MEMRSRQLLAAGGATVRLRAAADPVRDGTAATARHRRRRRRAANRAGQNTGVMVLPLVKGDKLPGSLPSAQSYCAQHSGDDPQSLIPVNDVEWII